MNLLSDALGVHDWLAILRIGIGLWWIKSVFHKDIPKFLRTGMASWTVEMAESHPWSGYGNAIKRSITATSSWFPYLVLFGELAVGVGLTFGFLTPISALVGIFLNINYILLAGVKLKDESINPCFRVEQGQNWSMILAELLIIAIGAGAVWSVDNLVGILQ
jgi:thiosulfate dehydrogenase [quinone] large subunit